MVSLVSLTSVLLDKLLAIWRRFSLILSGYVFSSSHLSSKPVFPFFQEKKKKQIFPRLHYYFYYKNK